MTSRPRVVLASLFALAAVGVPLAIHSLSPSNSVSVSPSTSVSGASSASSPVPTPLSVPPTVPPETTVPLSDAQQFDVSAADGEKAAAAEQAFTATSNSALPFSRKLGQIGTVTFGVDPSLESLPLIADADDSTVTGADSRELARGILAWKQPDGQANCDTAFALLGHRTSSPALLRHIDTLVKPGDFISMTLDAGFSCRWQVQTVTLTPKDEANALLSTVGKRTLLISACSDAKGNPGGVSHRWVVRATQVGLV
jgi:hypothetical protein